MQQSDGLNTHGDEISIAYLLACLWRSRWLMLAVIALFVALGLTRSYYFKSYVSEGFFQFGGTIPNEPAGSSPSAASGPGMALVDHKRYAAAYTTKERLYEWAREKKLDAEDGVDRLKSKFSSGNSVEGMIQPVYPFTRLDAKQLMDRPNETSNRVIGLTIAVADKSPEIAQQMVTLLGRYVMDTVVYLTYSSVVQEKITQAKNQLLNQDNVILRQAERLAEYRRKADALKQIVSRYPQTASVVVPTHVISVTDESARYLSPVTLLMTTEVQEAEAREAIIKAKREQAKAAQILEYYQRLAELIKGTRSGETILGSLEAIKDSAFKGKSMEDDVIKEVYNVITVENQIATNVYLDKSRFVAGPTLPTRSTARPVMTLALSLAVGLLCAVFAALVRQWWINNRAAILR